MKIQIGLMLISLFVLLSASALFANTLPVVAGKSVGPIALGMTPQEAEHCVRGIVNEGSGNPPYLETGWDSVTWSINHFSIGNLRVIYKDNHAVQIEISTHPFEITQASLDAAYSDKNDDEYKAYKAILPHLVVMTAPLMTTSFKVIRQSHPGMQVREFSTDDNPNFCRSYYYMDDVAHGIAFTFLAEDGLLTDDPKHKKGIQNLTPDDLPERIIIHRPGVSVLALYEGKEYKPVHLSPYLAQIRAWFAAKPPVHKGN